MRAIEFIFEQKHRFMHDGKAPSHEDTVETVARDFGMKIQTPEEFIAQSEKKRRNQISQSIAEATKLAAPTRELTGQELTDYLDRIRNRAKKKTDKYNLPYIHRSSVVRYYDEAGNKYDTDKIKRDIAVRPKKILKKNEKMRHSDGEQEQFFNVGFAALRGIALDEETNNLLVVDTCPGAGSCKVKCFAMSGGKIQFDNPWLSDARLTTFLLNDPDGFFAQLEREIKHEVARGLKDDYKVSIRWHDAADFFSPEYVDLAFAMARKIPQVDFYAYTKMADVVLNDKPENFIINWSEGANTAQEKKIKARDPELKTTKNSRIVPPELFDDLLIRDSEGRLIKGAEDQWQIQQDKLPLLKQRLADQYGLSRSSILSYSEYDTKRTNKNLGGIKYNVIIAPGEPDLTAKDPGVLSTLLLEH